MTAPLRNGGASANPADSLDVHASEVGDTSPVMGPPDLVVGTGKEECRTVARGMVTANNRATMHLSRLLLLALAVAACRDATGSKQQPAPAPYAGSAIAAPEGSGSGSGMFVPQQKAPDTPPGTNPDYVPAEFKTGMSRWKDVGVYVDGKPLGLHDVRRAADRAQADVREGQGLGQQAARLSDREVPRLEVGPDAVLQVRRLPEGARRRHQARQDDARLRTEVLADDRGHRKRSAVEGGRRVHVPVRRLSSAARRSRTCRRTSATASSPTRSTA